MIEKLADLGMTYDGDFLVNSKGDFAVVSGDYWLVRELIKIFRTSNPEWKWCPDCGADLDGFSGKENTRENAKNLEDAMREAIRRQFPDYALDIRIVPLGKSEVSIFVSFSKASGSPRNLLNFSFSYDSSGITISRDPAITGEIDPYFDDIQHQEKSNKYIARRGTN